MKFQAKEFFQTKKKNEKIQNWPKPTTVEQLNTFLGVLNYYSKFINKYEALTTHIEKLFDNGVVSSIFIYPSISSLSSWSTISDPNRPPSFDMVT